MIHFFYESSIIQREKLIIHNTIYSFYLIPTILPNPIISATQLLNNKRPLTLFKAFRFLKFYQDPCQVQENNKGFTQLRRQQQLLTSMHRALKVTADVL